MVEDTRAETNIYTQNKPMNNHPQCDGRFVGHAVYRRMRCDDHKWLVAWTK